MSFAYLPLFTGDYLRDTRHLTPLKHGIYILLLMHCWDQKGPAPNDEQECAGIANCRSADEIESLRYILDRYFVHMDDGWYNKRMMQEIETSSAISGKRSDAAHVRWEARKKIKEIQDASAMQVHSKCNASAPSLSPSPSLEPEEKKKTYTRFDARMYLSKSGLDAQTITDWLAIRKDKKLTPTKLALEEIQREAEKAGFTVEQAIKYCCKNSWAGFKASWITSEGQAKQSAWAGAS